MPHIGDGERRFAHSTKTAHALLCSIYLDRACATCVAPVAMLSHKLLDCAVHADTDGAQPKQHYQPVEKLLADSPGARTTRVRTSRVSPDYARTTCAIGSSLMRADALRRVVLTRCGATEEH